jgi:hypothetical protein
MQRLHLELLEILIETSPLRTSLLTLDPTATHCIQP